LSYDDEYQGEYEVDEEEVLAGILSANLNETLVRNRRILIQNENSLKRKDIRLRFLASCGHLIHGLEELGGRCQHKGCDALVCRDCLRICERCFKLLCPKHAKLHNGRVYCPTCKWIVFFFGGFANRGIASSEAQLLQLQPRAGRRGILRNIFFDSSLIERWKEAVARTAQGGFWRDRDEPRY